MKLYTYSTARQRLAEVLEKLRAKEKSRSDARRSRVRRDMLDKVDRFALKRHAAYAAVTVAGFANRDARPGPRQSRAQIEAQIKANGFDVPMRAFGQWEDWTAGRLSVSTLFDGAPVTEVDGRIVSLGGEACVIAACVYRFGSLQDDA